MFRGSLYALGGSIWRKFGALKLALAFCLLATPAFGVITCTVQLIEGTIGDRPATPSSNAASPRTTRQTVATHESFVLDLRVTKFSDGIKMQSFLLSPVPGKHHHSVSGTYSYRSATIGSTFAARRAGM
jgi:hypothetical protein